MTVSTPEFYVLYNGKRQLKEDEHVLRLSDAYSDQHSPYSMELVTKVIDINVNSGSEVLRRSRALWEYSYFVELARKFEQSGSSTSDALTKAVRQCIDSGIMKHYLENNGSEVISMLRETWTARDEGYEEGYEKGLEEGKKNTKLDIIKKALMNGLSDSTILTLTDISADELAQIKSQLLFD